MQANQVQGDLEAIRAKPVKKVDTVKLAVSVLQDLSGPLVV